MENIRRHRISFNVVLYKYMKYENTTNHPMLSSSHPTTTANKLKHLFKEGGVTKEQDKSSDIEQQQPFGDQK